MASAGAGDSRRPPRFIITDDSGLGLGCLNGFPGVYIKHMLHALGDAGIGSLVAKYPDRSATATVTLGVIDTDTETRRCTSVDYGKPGDASELPQIQTFTGEISGTIVDAPRGGVKHGSLSWNTIFVPDGFAPRTFGEMAMEEHATMSMRHHAFAAFVQSCL